MDLVMHTQPEEASSHAVKERMRHVMNREHAASVDQAERGEQDSRVCQVPQGGCKQVLKPVN